MDFPRPSMSASELFGDLKDKLGFGGGRSDRRDDYYDDPYYDDYADPEPAQGPYDSGYDPDTYGDPYDRLEYTTRSTGSSRCNHECLWRIRCCSKAHHGTSQRVSSHGS